MNFDLVLKITQLNINKYVSENNISIVVASEFSCTILCQNNLNLCKFHSTYFSFDSSYNNKTRDESIATTVYHPFCSWYTSF